MEKTMQEVLYENKMKVRAYREERKRKQKRKEIIIDVALTVLLVLVIAAILILLNNEVQNGFEKCTEVHSAEYCKGAM